jgi:aspartyl-tRNA(Asn)/glutamyl-tRNA(Gln) amidotransferase subunit C
MEIDRHHVEHVAKLAKIAISEEEVEPVRAHLEQILRYVDKLSELDLDGVAPTTHAVELVIRTREDCAGEQLEHSQVVSNAHRVVDGMFHVPKVVEG